MSNATILRAERTALKQLGLADECPGCDGKGYLSMGLLKPPDGRYRECPWCDGTGLVEGPKSTVDADNWARLLCNPNARVMPDGTLALFGRRYSRE